MVLGVCIVILTGLGCLAFFSRKEQGELLQRMSSFLYKLCCVYRFPFVEGQQVGTDLERLNPGISARELQLVILVLFLGSMLTCLLCVKMHMEKDIGTEAVLERGAVGEGDREVYLTAEIAGEKEEVYVNVVERQLEKEELETLFSECAGELEVLILGENESLEQVMFSLNLPDYVEGYPFEIGWKSSDSTLIGSDGELKLENGSGQESVCLTATLYYGEQTFTHDILVRLELTQQELSLGRRLQEAVWQKDEESRYEDVLPLPEELEGSPIHWEVVQEDNSLIFLFLTIGAAVGVFVLKDKDLHEQTLARKRELKMAYPVILNKFVLYMGAGMTVRGSFVKIATDSQKNASMGAENVAYEEMLYSCNELRAGVSEGQVYERFGKRSGLQEYARFAAMLGQNLKKGNSALLARLREESEKALQEDLQFRKKLGEEAETKLLIPMVMMMGIVMLLVMIPAFTAF